MGARLLCKTCKSIIESSGPTDEVYCSCGKVGIIGNKPPISIKGRHEDCALVDDKGNEIFVALELPDMSDEEVYKQLMLSINHQIEAMENLSQGARFSPCTNQDLLAHLIWIQAVLKIVDRRLAQASSSRKRKTETKQQA